MSFERSERPVRPETLVRICFGSALMIRPAPLLRVAPNSHADRRAEIVARILGARHLVEAFAIALGRGPAWIALGCAIDTTHALTAFGFAAADRRYRRLALTNGITATCFALAGARELAAAD